MPETESEFEEKLRKLGSRIHHGWTKLYPVKEKHMKAVRDAAAAQWERENKMRQQVAAARKVSTNSTQSDTHGTSPLDSSRRQDRRSRGHSQDLEH